MKVNILGTEYTLKEINFTDDPKLTENGGYCDASTKECVVDTMDSGDVHNLKNMAAYKNTVKRHEIIHAFLHESGLDCCSDWAQCEEMVDWIAIQAPKMFKAFEETGCL